MAALVMSMVVAATVVVGFGVGRARSSADHVSCPSNTERVSGLTATAAVRCGRAQEVAAAFDAEVMEQGTFPEKAPMSVLGFSCGAAADGDPSEESFSVRCASRDGSVRFVWGV